MKNSIKVLACALALSTTAVFATPSSLDKKAKGTFETGVYSTASGRLVVTIEKSDTQPVKVLIKDEDGDIVSKGLYGRGQEKVAVKFDIDELKSGQYKIEVDNGNMSKTQNFDINDRTIVDQRTIKIGK